MTLLGGMAGELGGRDDARPPLVLLHGLTFDRKMWRPALTALEAADPGRRTLTLDLPGHGDSPPRPTYAMAESVERVHRAVEEAGLVAPVLVGHSLGAVISTIYATEYPVSGVLNVDQSLEVEPFAANVASLRDALAGPGFPAVWERFAASMEMDRLSEPAQELLRRTSTPRQELVLGYWSDVLERPARVAAWARSGRALLRARRVPYEIVVGRPSGTERAWFGRELPQATVTEMTGGGHFPHLGDPQAFAARLATTADWACAIWRVPQAA
jgi:pimeloyl-ACP methyl ester carboxylesterase